MCDSDPDHYRRIFLQVAEPWFMVDSAGRFIELNSAAVRLLGIGLGCDGISLAEMITDRALREDFFRRLEQEGFVREARLTLDTFNGVVIDALVTATIIRDANGAIEGYFGSIRDVTLETQMCTLLASMARFPAVDPNPVMRVNDAGVLTYANTASAPLLEAWSVQVGRPLPSEPLERVCGCLADNLVCQFELTVAGHTWLIVCAPVAGEKYLNLYGLDITARREAEIEVGRQASELALANEQLKTVNERLNQEAKRLELIVRGIGDGVIVTDLDHRVTMMNHIARGLLEVTGQAGTGSMLASLFGDCTPPPARLKEMLEACQPDRAEEIMLVLHEPCPRTLRIVASAWVDPACRIAGRVLILRDVTREREIDQFKTDFVGSVSHILRTPLTSIKGFTKALRQDGAMTESLRNQFLDIIDQETQRLEALIEDMLEISRLESGRMKMERRLIEIPTLIEAACTMLSPVIESSALTLKLEIAESLPRPIGDLEALKRVLINILSNAIKFTPPGGTITVGASGDHDGLTLTVTDTGIGISQTDLPHVFERFYRAHRPGMEVAGTGLGLAIVHEIIERHGGSVEIGSELGYGTVVLVKLPVKDSPGS
ncbi:PAS domain-containing protein [bacterium]|nr:PAS domain-containing protein [bacterium]